MVYIFLADGFEEIEALTQIDYLRRANIDIISVGIEGSMIKGAHAIEVKADITIDELDDNADFEMLILPGGLGGVSGISASQKAMKLIKRAIDEDKYIGAICAAPTILAKEGYLNGKNAVCYPSMSDELHMCSNSGKGARVATDGKLITSISAGASEEFSMALIEALKGGQTAQSVREAIFARQ